ncbi:MAG: alpha-ribazole phosphatase family protein [Gammaproteobacteria bacterium]|nr:alpha-ribazole phosphatase family protein [Gammaproteobacteria bacterium]
MKETTIIDFIRHGEPRGGSRYRGHSIDDPLTDKGWQQMWRGVGDASPWDMILTSPLIRCALFAETLGERHNIPVIISEQLKEIGFGAWEGKTKDDLKRERGEEFAAFYTDPVNCTPQGAEPVSSFFQRISTFFDSTREHHAGKHLLVVAHAGVIRAALTHAIGADAACIYRFDVTNGNICRVVINDDRMQLVLLNGQLD